MSSLREEVADRLENLLADVGFDDPWTARAGASTRDLYSTQGLYAADRLRLHDELADAQEQGQVSSPAGGRLAVVVTAGAPGAGKSTAVSAQQDLAGFLAVDADDFKDPLLIRAAEQELLGHLLDRALPDGKSVALPELGGFVHAESTAIADAMRVSAMQ